MNKIYTVRGWMPLPDKIAKWYKDTDSMVKAIISNNPKMKDEVKRLLLMEWKTAEVRKRPFLETWIEKLN